MNEGLKVCLHNDVSWREWDSGVDPDTGYHDAGISIICRDCGEEFTEREFIRSMDEIQNHLDALVTGTVLEAPLGITIEVLHVENGELTYRCRSGESIISPLRKVPLPVIIANLFSKNLCRVNPTDELC